MNGDKADAKAIFLDALDCDGDTRQRFLNQACAEGTPLRGRVDELLRAHAEAGSFLGGHDNSPIDNLGHFVGTYKLIEPIGEGGMGLVYIAEQLQPVRRKVAIKVIKPGMDSREVVARFEAERQALALMDHPNIAHVFDAGATESGRPYFVMELVQGIGIIQFCDEKQLTLRERLELFIDVCMAVQHAHQKGIIHRDLKGTNILVASNDGLPVVKVIDFGVAKAVGQELTEKPFHTRFSQIVGTPMSMSPEQAELGGLDIDTRSDIYSLGVLLYEFLTGRPPFDQDLMRSVPFDEMRRIIREEEPPKPSSRVSTLGSAAATVCIQRRIEPKTLRRLFRSELDWIVMKSLEKDRNHRYETASAFAADVRRYLDDEPVLACPPGRGYKLGKFLRRHRHFAIAVSFVLLALIAGIVGTTQGMFRARAAKVEALDALEEKQAALVSLTESEKIARERLFEALLNQARAGRTSRRIGQRLESLEAVEKAAGIQFDDRLRDEAIAAMGLNDLRLGKLVHAHPKDTHSSDFDDRYETYARLDRAGSISIHRSSDDGKIREITTDLEIGPASLIRMSPDGRFVAVIDERRTMQIRRVSDGGAVLAKIVVNVSLVRFSTDSRRLAVASGPEAFCIDLETSQETSRWKLSALPCALAYHPKEYRLAIAYADSNLVAVFDTEVGKRDLELPVESSTQTEIAWHPLGDRLAVGGADGRIRVYDVAKKQRLATLVGHGQQITAISYHPEGNLLASTSWDGTIRLWEPSTSRQLMQLSGSALARFDQTGRIMGAIYRHDEFLQLIEATVSSEYRTLECDLNVGFNEGDISTDGRFLAISMEGSGDGVWDLVGGKRLIGLPTRSRWTFFGASGRDLYNVGNYQGIVHTSIAKTNDATNELRFGTPRTITLSVIPTRAALGSDGRTLAFVSEQSGIGQLLDLQSGALVGKPLPHPLAAFVAYSSDGRWVATSGWHSDRVRLWNAKTSEMVHEWVTGIHTSVYFTPDSGELIQCRGDAFTFWNVETKKQTRRWVRDATPFPGYIAFSRNGKLMALEMAPAAIHLKDVATGTTIAKLEDPNGDRADWMAFTSDGTQLVVVSYAKALHVWGLSAIRRRLKPMGLDWKWPEFAAAAR